MPHSTEHSSSASTVSRSGMVAPSSRGGARNLSLLPDARVSITAVFAYSVALFFVDGWAGMAVFAAVLVVVLAAWRVPLVTMGKALTPLAFILAFTVVAHIPQGFLEGVFYALRIALLTCATLAVAFSYDDTRLVRAFTSMLAPLRVLHVPVDDIATMLSIAVRFIPVCMQEFKRVVAAQRARCAHFDDGSTIARIRQWASVLAPMLVGLFRRAGVLAQVMEARCYGTSTTRTSLHGDARMRARDVAGMLAFAAAVLAAGFVL